MLEFLQNIIKQVSDIFGKLDNTKKIIIGVVAGVVVIAFVVLFSVSSDESNSLLFSKLQSKEFGEVTKKLEEMGYFYDTKNTSIFVRPNERRIILVKLAQENLLQKAFRLELFDVSKWTETEKELNVKYKRALQGSIKRTIQSLKNIKTAHVSIALPEENLFDKYKSYTAAVTVHFASGYDKLKSKEIKGIQVLVARAVGNRLKAKNVSIFDNTGKEISNLDDEIDSIKKEYTQLEFRRKEEEKRRIRILMDIKNGLDKIFTPERVDIVRLNMDFDWDKIRETKKVITPIITRPDNPSTPYSELKTKDSFIVSRKKTEENFKGHGWNPKGPAGTEGNKPPGYKASDDQYAKYNKKETIENHIYNESNMTIERSVCKVKKVSVSINIDGIQNLPVLPTEDMILIRKKRLNRFQ